MSGGIHTIPEDVLDRIVETIAAGHGGQGLSEHRQYLDGLGAADALDELEAAAAATSLAFGAADGGPYDLPDTLRQRCLRAAVEEGLTGGPIRDTADQTVSSVSAPAVERAPLRFQPPVDQRVQRSPGLARLGWLAAAACLVIAAAAWWPSTGTAAGSDAAELRQTLIASADDLVRWDWAAWDDEYAGTGGDVVWSESRQEGYMVLAGLPANDPSESQYQLWVVESSRGVPLETEPVDGGVFDIPAGSTEVVVPIRAALRAEGVAAFAVTREAPGGVVVSDQSRRVVIAAPPAIDG
ncbi:MAG: anti-sigma factor [Planctomycetota bacterium]